MLAAYFRRNDVEAGVVEEKCILRVNCSLGVAREYLIRAVDEIKSLPHFELIEVECIGQKKEVSGAFYSWQQLADSKQITSDIRENLDARKIDAEISWEEGIVIVCVDEDKEQSARVCLEEFSCSDVTIELIVVELAAAA